MSAVYASHNSSSVIVKTPFTMIAVKILHAITSLNIIYRYVVIRFPVSFVPVVVGIALCEHIPFIFHQRAFVAMAMTSFIIGTVLGTYLFITFCFEHDPPHFGARWRVMARDGARCDKYITFWIGCVTYLSHRLHVNHFPELHELAHEGKSEHHQLLPFSCESSESRN